MQLNLPKFDVNDLLTLKQQFSSKVFPGTRREVCCDHGGEPVSCFSVIEFRTPDPRAPLSYMFLNVSLTEDRESLTGFN